MKNVTKQILATVLGTSVLLSAFVEGKPKQGDGPSVLMVLSSYGEKNTDGDLVKPGFEFDEMSKSYLVFDASGVSVTFASPKGGALITDNYDPKKSYNQAFLADEEAVKALSDTRKLSEIDPSKYDAVYVVGGKGPMFDLATDQHVKTVIRGVYENDGIVGAVCHGPAALLDVKLSDGRFLTEGKRISAFTNEEEDAFTKAWTLPFKLEDQLIAQGAEFRQDGLMLNQISIDGRIITGQNPFSTADSARAVVRKLGLDVDETIRFKDDETVELIEAFFTDKEGAEAEFSANTSAYDPMLLGMFGLYQAKYAQTQAQRDVAINLMLQTQDIINHPKLDAAIATAYLDNADLTSAKALLRSSVEKFPDNETLAAMLNTLGE